MGIFEEHGITDELRILETLELYKFMTRNEILIRLAEIYADKQQFGELTNYKKVPIFSIIEGKYDVFLQMQGESVCVYKKAFSVLDLNALELDLAQYNTVIFNITPLNYLECAEKKKPPYDSNILFKRILIEALRLGATDVHFDVKHIALNPVYTVSYRRDADLIPLTLFELNVNLNHEIITSLVEKKTGSTSMDLRNSAGVTANAVDIFGDSAVELRISGNTVRDGYHYVVRVQEKKTINFSLNELGFCTTAVEDLRELLDKRSGISLITGAIRTGKNTTAYALLNELVDKQLKLISYESPIEVLMPFTQVDYFSDVDTLLDAVRLAKKQDVNIAFINEIPNKEVAFALQDLANSSLHVITTMHVDRAWHIPYKLKEYFGDNYKDVLSQLNGVFNQKMFGVSCPYCVAEYLTAQHPSKRVREFLRSKGITVIHTNTGCEHCAFTKKIIGRNQPYMEHLIFTDELKSDLLQCEHPYQMEELIKKELQSCAHTLEDYMLIGLQKRELPVDSFTYVL